MADRSKPKNLFPKRFREGKESNMLYSREYTSVARYRDSIYNEATNGAETFDSIYNSEVFFKLDRLPTLSSIRILNITGKDIYSSDHIGRVSIVENISNLSQEDKDRYRLPPGFKGVILIEEKSLISYSNTSQVSLANPEGYGTEFGFLEAVEEARSTFRLYSGSDDSEVIGLTYISSTEISDNGVFVSNLHNVALSFMPIDNYQLPIHDTIAYKTPFFKGISEDDFAQKSLLTVIEFFSNNPDDRIYLNTCGDVEVVHATIDKDCIEPYIKRHYVNHSVTGHREPVVIYKKDFEENFIFSRRDEAEYNMPAEIRLDRDKTLSELEKHKISEASMKDKITYDAYKLEKEKELLDLKNESAKMKSEYDLLLQKSKVKESTIKSFFSSISVIQTIVTVVAGIVGYFIAKE